jgi:nucleoid DNA-binding protein
MEAKVLIPDLANAVALRRRIPLKDAEAFVKQFFDLISERIISDKLLKIKGLGTFKLVEVLDRESINVNNGERIVIPGHMKVVFTPDAQLKNIVNKPFSVFQTVILNENTPLEEMEKLGKSDDTIFVSHSSDEKEKPAAISILDEIVVPDDETEDSETIPADIAIDEIGNSGAVVVDVATDGTEDSSSSNTKTSVYTNETGNSLPSENLSASHAKTVQLVPEVLPDMNTNHSTHMSLLHRIIYIVAILLLMIGCYMAGYYRIPNIKQIGAAFVPKSEILVAAEESKLEPASEKDPEELAEEKTMREAIDRYPQVPGGKYLIVGTKGVRQMKRGDTLLKMARQEYGHPDFAQYIIVYNQFADPDVIPLGCEVNLPLLVEQDHPQ